MASIIGYKIVTIRPILIEDEIIPFKAIKKRSLMEYVLKSIKYIHDIIIKLLTKLMHIFQGFWMEDFLHIFVRLSHMILLVPAASVKKLFETLINPCQVLIMVMFQVLNKKLFESFMTLTRGGLEVFELHMIKLFKTLTFSY